MLRTTMGQLMVNHGLPEDLRDYSRVLDKKGIEKFLQTVAEKHPEKYRDVVQHLSQVGYRTAQATGGLSFGLQHMRQALAAKLFNEKARQRIKEIYANKEDSHDVKEAQVVDYLFQHGDKLTDDVLRESIAEDNPLAMQVLSGSRGNPTNLRSLRAGDLLYVDHKDRPIPVPVLRSYSQGLRPVEYYAGTFGARKGVISTKFATQQSGFYSKQLNQISHRLVVSGLDREPGEEHAPMGMPTTVDDPDNEGALLAKDIGTYKRNTILTPKILADIRAQGFERLLVRSPIAGGHPNGGLYSRDIGIREMGGLARVGENPGISSAQALSEPVTQGMLGAKHGGGVAKGRATGPMGFTLVNQLIQSPKTFKGGAAHAQVDGKVTSIRPAPQGGTYITVDNKQHYVGHGYDATVKVGDEVEAGDILSDGIPNPAEIVNHKGLGEGRRYFVKTYTQACKDSGIPVHRRNVEILARGLIDHVAMDAEVGDHVPGDTVLYSRLEHSWEPREDHKVMPVKDSKGMYLERPVLHYSIGTKMRPSVLKTLDEYGIKNVAVHKDPAPFTPTMIRGMENLAHDPDWMTRFLGSYLKKNFLRGVHSGDISDEKGTSYVPSLARSAGFGQTGPVQSYKPTTPLPTPPKPASSILQQMETPETEHTLKVSSIIQNPFYKRALEELPFQLEYPSGTYRQLSGDPDDDDDDDDDFPLREITYPVDCGTLGGYRNELGESLTLFQGTDPKGEHGSFIVARPERFQTETKFYRNLSPFEKDQLLRAFAPILQVRPREYKTSEELFKALSKFQ